MKSYPKISPELQIEKQFIFVILILMVKLFKLEHDFKKQIISPFNYKVDKIIEMDNEDIKLKYYFLNLLETNNIEEVKKIS